MLIATLNHLAHDHHNVSHNAEERAGKRKKKKDGEDVGEEEEETEATGGRVIALQGEEDDAVDGKGQRAKNEMALPEIRVRLRVQ